MGCSARVPITRDTIPVNRPEIEILSGHTALIRTAESDISVLRLSDKQWVSFQETSGVSSQRSGGILPYPPGDLFFIIISNTSEHNLTGLTVSCSPGNLSMIKARDLGEKYQTGSDVSEVCERLFAVRRLMSFEYDYEKIDLGKDSLLQQFPFILPLDKICFLAAFPPVPADVRSYTVSISYSCASVKKTVDFRFTRLEHREEE